MADPDDDAASGDGDGPDEPAGPGEPDGPDEPDAPDQPDEQVEATTPSDGEPAESPKKAAAGSGGGATASKDASASKRRGFSWWWLLPAAMLVEFWVYGHNGYIDVCVGKEGETDFNLVGQPRTDANRWKFPRCETRTNLGLRSNYDERVEEATKVACRGATLFRFQGEAKSCEAQEESWKRQVSARFCPPWDPNYYEHLFWFLK